MKRNRLSQFMAAILVNAIYQMKNYPVILISTVLSPLSFLVLIDFVSHGNLIGEAIEGGLIMSIWGNGTSILGDLAHLKNDFKLQDMVVSSPTPWHTYLIGMAISELVSSVPALLVLSILAGIYLHLNTAGVLQLIAVLLMMFTTSIMIGYTFSTFSSDIVQAGGFSRLVSTLLSTIPPVYYPITYIPFPYRYLAYLSPTTYAAELAQSVAGYLTLSLQEKAFSWIILIGITVALVLITRSKARWREI